MQNDAVSYATLTEADTDPSSGTMGRNTTSGSDRITISGSDMAGQVFTASGSGRIQSVSFYAVSTSTFSSRNAKAVITDSSGNILANGISNAVTVNSGWDGAGTFTATFATPPVVQNGQTYWIMIIPDGDLYLYYTSSTGGTSKSDTTNSYTSPTSPTDASSVTYNFRRLYASINYDNYQLDQEVQFSGVTNYASYTQLQINTGTFSGSETESLEVYYWRSSDSTWQLLGTLTASNLKTFDVTGLVGTTFDLRFYDATRTSDATQNTWQIDYVRLVAP
jgi:hypothetical protein